MNTPEDEPEIILEVCVDSVESAKAAVDGGAQRLELCGSLACGGGVTPSMGLVKAIKQVCPDVGIMVMIRPRVGDFYYTRHEMQTIFLDIQEFKTLGIQGFVLGMLETNGRVDVPNMRMAAKLADPLEVTFHRAFDMTRDFDEALKDISEIDGVTRILTSGISPGKSRIEVLTTLLKAAPPHLSVMPGSGIRVDTAKDLLETLIKYGLQEVHMSGGSWIPGEMVYRREGLGMGIGGPSEWGVFRTSKEEIKGVKNFIDGWNAPKQISVGATTGAVSDESQGNESPGTQVIHL